MAGEQPVERKILKLEVAFILGVIERKMDNDHCLKTIRDIKHPIPFGYGIADLHNEVAQNEYLVSKTQSELEGLEDDDLRKAKEAYAVYEKLLNAIKAFSTNNFKEAYMHLKGFRDGVKEASLGFTESNPKLDELFLMEDYLCKYESLVVGASELVCSINKLAPVLPKGVVDQISGYPNERMTPEDLPTELTLNKPVEKEMTKNALSRVEAILQSPK